MFFKEFSVQKMWPALKKALSGPPTLPQPPTIPNLIHSNKDRQNLKTLDNTQ